MRLENIFIAALTRNEENAGTEDKMDFVINGSLSVWKRAAAAALRGYSCGIAEFPWQISPPARQII